LIILFNSFAQQWGLLPFYTGIPHDGCYEFNAESAFLLGGDCYGAINGGFYQMNYFTNEGYYGLNASFNCNSDCEQCEYVFNDIDIGAGNCETMGNISFMGDYAYFPLLNPSSCFGYYFIAYFGEDSSCHVSHLSMVTGYFASCYEPGNVSFSCNSTVFDINYCNTNDQIESHSIGKCVYSSFAKGYVKFFCGYLYIPTTGSLTTQSLTTQSLSSHSLTTQTTTQTYTTQSLTTQPFSVNILPERENSTKHKEGIIIGSFGLFAILSIVGISIWVILRHQKKRKDNFINSANSMYANETSPLLRAESKIWRGLDNLDILFQFVKKNVVTRRTGEPA